MKLFIAEKSYDKITPIEAERVTKSSYWVNGERKAKLTNWDEVFETFDEAKEYLLKLSVARVANLESRIKRENERQLVIHKIEQSK